MPFKYYRKEIRCCSHQSYEPFGDKKIEKNILINEDCQVGLDTIEDQSIDLICTDLPFGQTARNNWDFVIPMSDYVILSNKIIYEKDNL